MSQAMYVKVLVVRVDLGGFLQKLFALTGPAGGQVNHRGLEEQFRVPHARRERFVHCVERLGELAIAIQPPGQRSLGREALPQLKILARPSHRLGAIPAHVGIEVSEVVKVMNVAALRRLEVSGERLFVPGLRLVVFAHEHVKVTERLLELRPGNARNDFLVKHDRFVKLPLRA